MKLIITAAAAAFLLSGPTAYAQMSKGSPAEAKQLSTGPMVKEKTYDQLHPKRGVTTGRPPGESRAQMGTVGGSKGGK
jgi:hypothetical protein